MFINFTNHPSHLWSQEQLQAATVFGEIRDVPFPAIDPEATEEDIRKAADKYTADIIALQPSFVLCQGEFCLAFAVAQRLKQAGIVVGAACSRRDVVERQTSDGETEKQAVFRFVKFRQY